MYARAYRLGLAVSEALSLLSIVALMVLAFMTLLDGLLRWLANAPIEGVRDIGGLATAVAVTCCIPIGLLERSNITIKVMEGIGFDPLSKALDLFAAALTAVVIAAIAYQFTSYAGKLLAAHETTWVLGIPTAPFWYAVAAIFWVAFAIQLLVAFLYHGRMVGRFEFPRGVEIDVKS
jgi:TRAP-type C4-dicarboxylate transport system permease small subunit